jgi:hypothetical protein
VIKTMEVNVSSHPAHLSVYMRVCLTALADHGLGTAISVGGGLGLLHYLDYRTTHDVDAWWTDAATPAVRAEVIRVLETTLAPYGQIKTRTWGDVVSVELAVEGQAVFSFQIAARAAQLEPSAKLPWVDVGLDSLSDLIAGKMVALIERGAPRDFRDIYTLCQAGLTAPEQCWTLWQRRQELSGSDTDEARARLAIETHLARIEQHRPLTQIEDVQSRTQAEHVRGWFREEFLNVIALD